MRKLSDTDVQRMVDLWNEGRTQAEIAAATGRAESTVGDYLRRSGVRFRHGSDYRKLTHGDVQPILDAYAAGMSIREVADALGHGRNAIGRVLKEAGVTRQSGAPPLNPELAKSLVRGYRRGLTAEDVGASRGVSARVVYKYLEKQGIERRSRGSRPRRVTKLTFLERILSRIEIEGECWAWQGGWKRTGKDNWLPWVEKFHKGHVVYRFLYEHYYGPLGEDRLLAACENKRCVNPDHRIVRSADPWQRALDRLVVDTDTFCWVVQVGDRKARLGSSDGYAHRRAWTEWIGPIPKGREVWRRCKNLRCINPDHLFLLPRHGDRFKWEQEEEIATDLRCRRGHLVVGADARTECVAGEVVRHCRVCRREDDAALRERLLVEEELTPRERFRRMRAEQKLAELLEVG